MTTEGEGTATPQVGTDKDADEASEDDAEAIQDAADTPKKAGKKMRRGTREQEEEIIGLAEGGQEPGGDSREKVRKERGKDRNGGGVEVCV